MTPSASSSERLSASLVDQFRNALVSDLKSLSRENDRTSPPFTALRQLADRATANLARWQKEAQELHRMETQGRADALLSSATDLTKALQERVARRREDVGAKLDSGFVVAGRILDTETGHGLPQLRVQVIEPVSQKERIWAETATDELGFFRVAFGEAQFKELFERQAELRVAVLDSQGQTLSTADRLFKPKIGKTEFVDVALDGAQAPASRDEATRLEADVQSNLDLLEDQTIRITQRLKSRIEIPSITRKPSTPSTRPSTRPSSRSSAKPPAKPSAATSAKAPSKSPAKSRATPSKKSSTKSSTKSSAKPPTKAPPKSKHSPKPKP